MPSNTPLPAAQLLALADAMHDQFVIQDHTQFNWNTLMESVKAYRAARAASPVTLEEALMAEYGRAYGGYFGQDSTADLFGPERDAWGAAATALGEHARRLAGEGGA